VQMCITVWSVSFMSYMSVREVDRETEASGRIPVRPRLSGTCQNLWSDALMKNTSLQIM
jgi:hypothetical protein